MIVVRNPVAVAVTVPVAETETGTATATATATETGFSLIEMLIVIALMALVGTFVLTNVMKRFDESKVSATKIQMKQIGTILDDFRRVCGFYPTTEQGLDALAT